MLSDFVNFRIRRFQGAGYGTFYIRCHRAFDPSERATIGQFILEQPMREYLDGITLAFPFLFFLFRPIVCSINVSHVVTVKTVGVTQDKARPLAPACFLHLFDRGFMYDLDVLPVNRLGPNSKRFGSGG